MTSCAFVRLAPLLLLVACGDSGGAKPDGSEQQAASGGPVGESSGVGGNASAKPVDAGSGSSQPATPGQGDFLVYSEKVGSSDVAFDMVPIAGGTFAMGSPPGEAGRGDDEGPQVEVSVDPFWMGKFEVTWQEYDVWNTDEDRPQSKKPDGMARPTPAYMEMTFNMGREGYPAICMSHVAALQYCKWLSEKTGHFYRLPTEAEWEYACRAGAKTVYSFGDDPSKLGDYAWYAKNSPRALEDGAEPEMAYHLVGKKRPNAFGLFDMHGNVAEWVADQYYENAYEQDHGKAPRSNPFLELKKDKRGRGKRWAHAVRGGSWQAAANELRSAARLKSEPMWNDRDPQIPKSWWYLTDAQHVGFRVVRPLREPSAEERALYETP